MTEPRPEFSRRVGLDKLGAAPHEMAVEAGPSERRALAQRFGLQELAMLQAEVTVTRPGGGSVVRVDGRMTADVVQTCVVSLEPVPAHIEEEFSVTYSAEERDASDEVVVEVDEEDWPEPIVGGAVDIGEAVAEQLALALEPFPRKPGTAFEGFSLGGVEEDDEKPRPFAKLAELKRRMK